MANFRQIGRLFTNMFRVRHTIRIVRTGDIIDRIFVDNKEFNTGDKFEIIATLADDRLQEYSVARLVQAISPDIDLSYQLSRTHTIRTRLAQIRREWPGLIETHKSAKGGYKLYQLSARTIVK